MNFADTILLLRDLLQDPEGAVWDDGKLSDFVNEAQTEYVRRSNCLSRSVDFTPDENGDFYFNDDFLKLKFAYNERDIELGQVTQHDLRYEYGSAVDETIGIPEYIYDGAGKNEFCLYPDPGESSTPLEFDQESGAVVSFDNPEDVFNQESGIVANIDNIPFNQESGVIYWVGEHTAIPGKIHYVRVPYKNIIEVRIAEALVFLAAAICLEDESEHKNLELADGYRGIFESMIGIENNLNYKQHGFKRGRGL